MSASSVGVTDIHTPSVYPDQSLVTSAAGGREHTCCPHGASGKRCVQKMIQRETLAHGLLAHGRHNLYGLLMMTLTPLDTRPDDSTVPLLPYTTGRSTHTSRTIVYLLSC